MTSSTSMNNSNARKTTLKNQKDSLIEKKNQSNYFDNNYDDDEDEILEVPAELKTRYYTITPEELERSRSSGLTTTNPMSSSSSFVPSFRPNDSYVDRDRLLQQSFFSPPIQNDSNYHHDKDDHSLYTTTTPTPGKKTKSKSKRQLFASKCDDLGKMKHTTTTTENEEEEKQSTSTKNKGLSSSTRRKSSNEPYSMDRHQKNEKMKNSKDDDDDDDNTTNYNHYSLTTPPPKIQHSTTPNGKEEEDNVLVLKRNPSNRKVVVGRTSSKKHIEAMKRSSSNNRIESNNNNSDHSNGALFNKPSNERHFHNHHNRCNEGELDCPIFELLSDIDPRDDHDTHYYHCQNDHLNNDNQQAEYHQYEGLINEELLEHLIDTDPDCCIRYYKFNINFDGNISGGSKTQFEWLHLLHILCYVGASYPLIKKVSKLYPNAINYISETHHMTCLHYACLYTRSSLKVIKYLLKLKPYMLLVTDKTHQWTPLHQVCASNTTSSYYNPDVVLLLTEIASSYVSNGILTPSTSTTKHGDHPNGTDQITNHSGDQSSPFKIHETVDVTILVDMNGNTPLHLACSVKKPCLAVIEDLTTVNPMACIVPNDTDFDTPLHILCSNKKYCKYMNKHTDTAVENQNVLKIMKDLIRSNPDSLKLFNKKGYLPLVSAIKYLHKNRTCFLKVVKLLAKGYPESLLIPIEMNTNDTKKKKTKTKCKQPKQPLLPYQYAKYTKQIRDPEIIEFLYPYENDDEQEQEDRNKERSCSALSYSKSSLQQTTKNQHHHDQEMVDDESTSETSYQSESESESDLSDSDYEK